MPSIHHRIISVAWNDSPMHIGQMLQTTWGKHRGWVPPLRDSSEIPLPPLWFQVSCFGLDLSLQSVVSTCLLPLCLVHLDGALVRISVKSNVSILPYPLVPRHPLSLLSAGKLNREWGGICVPLLSIILTSGHPSFWSSFPSLPHLLPYTRPYHHQHHNFPQQGKTGTLWAQVESTMWAFVENLLNK